MGNRLLREARVLDVLDVGKTKFREDYLPKLERVQLGPRAVAYTERSVQRLIQELIDGSATAPRLVPAPNVRRQRRAARGRR